MFDYSSYWSSLLSIKLCLVILCTMWCSILCNKVESSINNIDNLGSTHQHHHEQQKHRIPLNELPKLKNDLLLQSLTNQPTPRVPVWCMRQAGRHLPEFQSISQNHDFFSMCRNPELAVEVSLQPLRRYGVDAVIIFSDILVIPQAMGMEITMVEGKGPVFRRPLRSPDDIKSFGINLNPHIEKELGYVLDALNLARQEINGDVPLIGFCGGPLSLLMFMVEGESSKSMKRLKSWLYNHPIECHHLLKSLSDICVNFLISQQQAGAQVLQVFESVGVEGLTQKHFFEFVFPYLEDIATRVKDACPDTPIIIFSKGTDYALEKLAETKFDCLGLDWTSDPEDVKKRIGGKKALQGNLDPCVIYAKESVIESEVHSMIKAFGTRGYVANFGHGCFPDMDPHHVNIFIKSVQQTSLEMNKMQ